MKVKKEVAGTEDEPSEKKCNSRSIRIDTLNYLRENGEREQNFKMAELELKKAQKYEI